MRVVIQRVKQASVIINEDIKRSISHGYMILLGIEHEDNQSDIDWLVKKIMGLRIFSDEENKMNLAISEVSGSILLISQFTLHASTKKGNRPSYSKAAIPETAIPLYEGMIKSLVETGTHVQTGAFGADMQVSLTNDGPVTIIIDSKTKE
jgi:D-tyrosyl-tRNA(Tyr) deacylase